MDDPQEHIDVLFPEDEVMEERDPSRINVKDEILQSIVGHFFELIQEQKTRDEFKPLEVAKKIVLVFEELDKSLGHLTPFQEDYFISKISKAPKQYRDALIARMGTSEKTKKVFEAQTFRDRIMVMLGQS